MKVEIFKENEKVDLREFISAKGNQIKIYSQTAFIHCGGRFPLEISLPLTEGQAAYPCGIYSFSEDSFCVGDFKRPAFSRDMKLVPFK